MATHAAGPAGAAAPAAARRATELAWKPSRQGSEVGSVKSQDGRQEGEESLPQRISLSALRPATSSGLVSPGARRQTAISGWMTWACTHTCATSPSTTWTCSSSAALHRQPGRYNKCRAPAASSCELPAPARPRMPIAPLTAKRGRRGASQDNASDDQRELQAWSARHRLTASRRGACSAPRGTGLCWAQQPAIGGGGQRDEAAVAARGAAALYAHVRRRTRGH